jgi:hypothetical protein
MAKPAQRDTGSSSGIRGGASQREGMPADDKDILAEAKRRADEAQTAEYENIVAGRDCQRFYAGGDAQWAEDAIKTRRAQSRPVVTINRLPQFAKQVTGEIRKNPPSIKVLPSRGAASQQTADTYGGIIRNIEAQSNATDCYVKAAENVVQAGQGFFRVHVEYSSNDGFEQDIRIRQIADPFGGMIDPFARLPDKSDMRYAFVFDHMSDHDYQEEYPGKAVVEFQSTGWTAQAFPWRVGNTIRIAEYWRRFPAKKTLYMLDDGSSVEMDKEKPNNGVPDGKQVVNMREVEDFKVEYYILSGAAILSGPHPWAGRYIPICMVAGEEITMEASTVRKGLVHDARDPQRILNYSNSINVEAIALQPKAPFMATADQVKGREKMWAQAGSTATMTLIYNGDPKANGPPQRSPPALASQGIAELMIQSSQNLKDVTGIQDASLGAQSNETSGVAIANRQREGDTATFIFVDNLRRAVGYCGKILVDLIPRIYDTPRQIAILKEDGSSDIVTVNGPPKMDEKTQKPVHPVFNLSDGEYAVTVTTGPSFATQRQEAVVNMLEAFKLKPDLMGIAGDLLFKNLDGPGAAELAKRIGKTIPAELKDDSIEEMPKPQPDPEAIASGMKDAATAGKLEAETEGIKIENAAMLLQMNQTLQAIMGFLQGGQGMLAGGAPMGGPPGPPPGGPGPMQAPPPAPGQQMGPPPGQPMGQGAMANNDLPPMVEVGGDDLPPMVEVEGAPV